ncbi:hypothetical protein VNO80_07625 [Phaseolus coccineus]|uniref:50S ribosomal protein L22, chloroplastic n=1 Tax=Phaseolus coccineus TaxID=3886 RepID=A0AAN9NQY1_PHACN
MARKLGSAGDIAGEGGSPKKVNLVAALVRGMLVKVALMQLELIKKGAAKTVYQLSSSSDERLNCCSISDDPGLLFLTAEAFVGKGYFKKRIAFHAKGRSGLIRRPECRLTVIVREITPEEKADIARLRVHN